MPQKLTFDDVNQRAHALPDALKKQKLSILLPVYNESAFIAENILFIANLLRSWGWNFQIVASNDGSKDASWQKILSMQKEVPELVPVNSPRNFGKGRALASAFEASSGEYILFLDSDLELPAEHIPYFFERLLAENSDIVIGSKKDPRSDLFYPASRKLFSTLYFIGVKILFGLPVQDTQTGIKLFKRQALENTLPYLLVKRFAFDIELLVLCHSQGFKITSHPVVVRYIRDGIGRMGFQTILHMFKDTLAVFWRLRTRVWKSLPRGRRPLKCAVLTLGKATAHMGDHFPLEALDELPSLMPKLEGYDIALFLQEGEEIAPFMQPALERLFNDESVQAAVPLIYNKDEQGIGAKRYYTLANPFYPLGAYARFRPIRAHTIENDFPLSACALRLPCLKNLLKTPVAGIRVPKPHYSPFFFIHSEINQSDWLRFHSSEKKMDGYKKNCRNAFLVWLLGIPLIIFAFPRALAPYLSLWLLLEFLIFLWMNFSLGLRRGAAFYLYLCKCRFLSKRG